MVPVGLAGLADQHALERRAPVRVEQHVRRDRPARRRRGFDQDRFAAERLEDVAIRRIAGHRDRDAIAGLEQRQEGEDETGRRPGGRDHARGLDRDAVGLVVVPRDARAQRRDAERLGIGEPAGERRARGVERGRGRRARPAGRLPCGSPGRRPLRCAPPPPSTSITMNGGTSLRAEGTISRFAASSIDSTVRYRATDRPAVAAFGGFRCQTPGATARYQLAGPGAMGPVHWPRHRMRAATRRVIDSVTKPLAAGRQGPPARNSD